MEYSYSYPSYENLLFFSECANSYQGLTTGDASFGLSSDSVLSQLVARYIIIIYSTSINEEYKP